MTRGPYGHGQIRRLPSGSFRAVPPASWDLRPATFPHRRDAVDYLRRHAARRTLGVQIAEVRSDLRIEDVLQDYLADLERRGRRASTLYGYRSDCRIVAALWGDRRVDAVDGPFLERVISEAAARGWSASTIRNRLDRITGAVRYAMRHGVTPARPLPVARPQVLLERRPDPYTDAELSSLVGAAELAGAVELAAVLVAADCGLRRSEIVRLRRDDVDPDRVAVLVSVRGLEDRPKSGRARVVPATGRAVRALLAVLGRSEDRLAVSSSALTRRLSAVWRAAGVGPVRWHRLRHTWASRMARAGVSAWDLQRAAGWSSVQLANRYVHGDAVPGAGLLDAEIGTDAARPGRRRLQVVEFKSGEA